MKRTLTFSLLLATVAVAAAQTPAGGKSASADAKPKSDPQATAASAKPSPAAVKLVPVQKASAIVAKPTAVPAQPVSVSAAKPTSTASVQPAKSAVAKAGTISVQPIAVKPVSSGKSEAKAGAPAAKNPFNGRKKVDAVEVKTVSTAQSKPVGASPKSSEPPVVAKKIGAAGRRDPFISPVVNMSAVGSGCSTGKRCLNIEQIALRGVVRSDNGMIAVVVNALDKAYFLRENDPVFNGFVEKITADSIVFKETFHDKLGKPLTRDITKTISRPAV